MPRRYQPLNIPIEIVRTVVAISETGSLTKAAGKLGLSQPAVSSQIKRIQSMVGGALFARTANGTTATQLGKLVLHQARRILEANDQMLRLGGAAHLPQPVRLGLSTLFVREFLGHQTAQSLTDVVIQTDNSVGITKGLIDGYIDIAYILENPEMTSEIAHLIVNDTDEEFVWVRSRDFVLSPDSPIPILTWPGDDLMIRTLTRQGIAYNVVFNSPDYHAKLAAVEAGIGIAAIPRRLIPPSLV
jgi:DNA-binding transcriptional LysR family regulator